jgi:hypothetical protein
MQFDVFPNPFINEVNIPCDKNLDHPCIVRIQYQLVQTIFNKTIEPRNGIIKIKNGELMNSAPGKYYVSISDGDNVKTRPLLRTEN